MSYEKTGQFLKKFMGLEVSRNKIHGMALEEGRRIEQWEEEREIEGIGGEVPEVLYIQVDGTGVPTTYTSLVAPSSWLSRMQEKPS